MNRRTFIQLLFLIWASKAIPQSSKKKAKVLVLGAGISGLAAAKDLQNNGFEVLVLEARSRIGGRIHTFHEWGYPMDLGASWIHGLDKNPITQLAKEANLHLMETDYESLQFWSQGKEFDYLSKIRSAKEFQSMEDELEEFTQNLKKDVSLNELFIKARENLDASRKPLIEWLFLTHESNLAESLDRVSAISFFKEAELFAGEDAIFERGYEGITNYVSRGLDIRSNQIVIKIQSTAKEVHVKTDKESFSADFCLVTLPLGVLKKGNVHFSPELNPNKKEALNRLNMGLLNKLYAEYDEPFWDKSSVSLGIRSEKQDFRFFLNYLPFFGKSTLVGFLPGDFGRAAERLSESALKEMLTKRLRQEIGKPIPVPKRVYLTRWNSDPFAFGSYSYFPIGSTGKDMLTLGESDGRLFFAGEHTSPKHYGYVHGGYLSGLRAAKEIKSSLL
jgi:polyamine oxidase